tara:strand:- start:151 stop:675 length:525 start_codon:yes stop_codon:yes gene_type:complete
MSIIVISTNLHAQSKTDALAHHVTEILHANDAIAEFMPLSNFNLPLCDGYTCYQDPTVIELQKRFSEAKSFIICSPIYCYDLNAVAKNLIELTGQSWKDKVVSFVCNAGGDKSYMSPIKFANSLMLDFRCLVLPRFFYASSANFDNNNNLNDSDSIKRLEQLAQEHIRLTAFSR